MQQCLSLSPFPTSPQFKQYYILGLEIIKNKTIYLFSTLLKEQQIHAT